METSQERNNHNCHGEVKPATASDGLFGCKEKKGETDDFIGMEIPAASRAHISGKGQQQSTQETTPEPETSISKETRKYHSSDDDVKEVLINQGLGDCRLRQPDDGS